MRIVRFRQGSGRPTDVARENLDELLMLTEAALSLTNVTRWAQERVLAEALSKSDVSNLTPPKLRSDAKTTQYETEVVDAFLQLGAQSFALHGSEALWERPMRTGSRGRPPSIDVALFNAEKAEEARIEFGYYSSKKVRDDARKLAKFSSREWWPDGIDHLTNYLIVWKKTRGQVSALGLKEWFTACNASAVDASDDNMQLEVRVASTQDAFSPGRNEKSRFELAIYQVLPVDDAGK